MTMPSWLRNRIPCTIRLKTKRARRHKSGRPRLYLGLLEDRTLPATVTWVGASGDWAAAANWLDEIGVNRLPGASDDAVINVAGVSVTHNSGSHTVKSLTINDPFALSGGTLTVTEDLLVQNGNSFLLGNGTLAQATVAAGTTITQTDNGTFDGVTVATGSTVQLTNGTYSRLAVKNGLTVDGTILVGDTVGAAYFGTLSSTTTQTIGGSGSIIFGNSSSNSITTQVDGLTITLGPGLTVRGKNGAISGSNFNGYVTHYVLRGTVAAEEAGSRIEVGHFAATLTNSGQLRASNGGSLIIDPSTWTNTGTTSISAGSTLSVNLSWNNTGQIVASDSTVNLGGFPTLGTWTNTGQITANNSTVNLGGSFTTASIGTINRTGGTINVKGLLDNTGDTLMLDATTGSWNLTGGTLRRGSLITSGGAALIAGSSVGGTLEGVTLGGTVGGVPTSATVQGTSGGFTVTGGLTLANSSVLELGNQMSLSGDQTVDGDGEIRLRSGGQIRTFDQATLGPGLTVRRTVAGIGGISIINGNVMNEGTIRVDVGSQFSVTGNSGTTFTNAAGGVLAAEGGSLALFSSFSNAGQIAVENAALVLGSGTITPWTNTGQITAINSTVELSGSFIPAALGTFNRSGGTVHLTGLLDNTGNTLTLDATTGSWNLTGGTLRRGSLVTSGGAALVAGSSVGGTLEGVTLGGTVGGVPISATVQGTSGGFTVTGGLTLANGSVVDVGNQMSLSGDQTVDGDGEIRLRSGGQIRTFDQATLGPGLTVYSSDATSNFISLVAGSLTNQGTIRADAGGKIEVSGNSGTTFTNAASGVLEAAGGTLVISTATTNYAAGTLTGGTWQAVGNGTVRITGADITTNAASIVLDGDGAKLTRDSSGGSALNNLSSNTEAGSFTIRNGANLVVSAGFHNAGTVTIGPSSALRSRQEGQYASSVLGFSSQFSSTSWSAAQATGPANTFSYGDFSTAWAPSTPNSTLEFLALGFATPVSAEGVVIRETYGNGFVYQVDLLDTDDNWHTMWTGTDPSQPGTPVDFKLQWPATPYLVKGVKIYVDTSLNTSAWEEMDSVQLLTAGGESFRQTDDATLAIEIGGTPASGQFGRLEAAGSVALDGTLDIRLVNSFGPTVGQTFPVMTFGGFTGTFDEITGLTRGPLTLFSADFSPTALELKALITASDLALDSVTLPAGTVAPGQQVSVPYTVRNLSDTAALGNWHDFIYLSRDGILDPGDTLLGQVHHQGDVAGLATYTETLTATLPALAEGSYHVLVVVDSHGVLPDPNRANNSGVSVPTMAMTVPVLVLGTPVTGTIASGQDVYYRLIVPPSQDLTVGADFSVPLEAEFYLRHRDLPDRSNFDQAAPPGDLLPRLMLTNPQGGSYYVLLHGREGAGGGASFTLSAEAAGFAITSFGPQTGSNQGSTTVSLVGSRFTPQTAVSLRGTGGIVRSAKTVLFVDSSRLKATFDLNQLPTGAYSIRADDAGQSADALDTFTVNDAAQGFVSVNIISPSTVFVGQPIALNIDIRNSSYSDAIAPIIVVDATNVSAGEETKQFLANDPDMLPGILPSGFEGGFGEIYFPSPKAAGTLSDFNMSIINPSLTPMEWENQKEHLRPSTIPADAWDAIWPNFRAVVGDTLADLYALLTDDAVALRQAGVFTNSISRLTSFELNKANNMPPLPPLTPAADLAFPAPGLPLVFARSFRQSIAQRYHLGRLGRGWADNFDVSATADSSTGFVTIRQGDSLRFFARNPDGSYVSWPGDFATLTRVGDTFRLREASGEVTAFRADGLMDYFQTPTQRVTAGYSGGQLANLTQTNGSALTLAYNAQGRISQVTGPAGLVATYSYDASGEHLTSVTTTAGTTQLHLRDGHQRSPCSRDRVDQLSGRHARVLRVRQ